jgi:hypothetical protein
MRTVERYDFGLGQVIPEAERTPEGYLRCMARVARTGVQSYRQPDGTIIREYRPPEEVAKPESLKTFGGKSVTWNHPPVALDSKNTAKYDIGDAGTNVNFTDGFVWVAITIKDQDKIDRIDSGEASEISPGYRVDIDDTPGFTPEGEPYDRIQRNIRVNHLAVVPRGRSGPEVRLLLDRMDSDGAVTFGEPPDPAPTKLMATVNLDGLMLELPAEAAPAVQQFAQAKKARIDALEIEKTTLSQRVDTLTEELEAANSEKEAAEGRADAFEAELAERQDADEVDENGDPIDPLSRIDAATLDKLLVERLDTLRHLAPAFEDDFKMDSLESDALYVQAYTNLVGEEPPEGASFERIAGVVDGLLMQFQEDEADEEEPPARYTRNTGRSTRSDRSDREDRAERADRAAEPLRSSRRFGPITRRSTSTGRRDSDSSLPLQQAIRSIRRNDEAIPEATERYRQDKDEAWKRPMSASKSPRR